MYEIFTQNIGPKCSQNLLKFGTPNISSMTISISMSKIIFMKYYHLLGPNCSQNVNAQDLLKFGTFDIPNIPISILMSNIILIKYFPSVSLRIYYILAHLIFQIYKSWFWYKICFLSNIYQLLGPNWSQNEKYPELIEIWLNWYFKYADLKFDVKNDS